MTSPLDISRSALRPAPAGGDLPPDGFRPDHLLFGMLGALPASAVRRVGLRGLHLAGRFYRGR